MFRAHCPGLTGPGQCRIRVGQATARRGADARQMYKGVTLFMGVGAAGGWVDRARHGSTCRPAPSGLTARMAGTGHRLERLA